MSAASGVVATMFVAKMKLKINKTVKQISRLKTVLFQPSHNVFNNTLKRFSSRRSPYACQKQLKCLTAVLAFSF